MCCIRYVISMSARLDCVNLPVCMIANTLQTLSLPILYLNKLNIPKLPPPQPQTHYRIPSNRLRFSRFIPPWRRTIIIIITRDPVISECYDERFKAYNASCYSFISFPEADWATAQQICRLNGAQLASISTTDEQR